jgi:uracil-DNA glycosylase
MKRITGNKWDGLLAEEWQKPYYQELRSFLIEEYKNETVYPPAGDIYNALRLTDYDDVKAVILGQDPYHEPGQAHGLAFSVPVGVTAPPSLVNIYKEMSADLSCPMRASGDLTAWAKQGVLLLNTVLTVREGQPTSHKGLGWEWVTDRIISELNKKNTPVVFLLWGAHAQKKGELITNPIHYKLSTVHPSPLSAHRGFFGCRHFSKANALLARHGMTPIQW